MVYHSENEEDTCHYKLGDRNNFKVSFVGRHFAGFLGKLKETIEKFARRTTIYTPDDVNSPKNMRAPYDLKHRQFCGFEAAWRQLCDTLVVLKISCL